ncbi:twin-arginine translocation signal domain-containing protein [bacterium]|nr:MAG: twin-arginine translocation signal domain-containing protein [bacterium]
MRLDGIDFGAIWQERYGDLAVGHAHFWDRALSRRQFIGAASAATGAALTSGLWSPLAVLADDDGLVMPRPVGQNFQPLGRGTEIFHFALPGTGDPSTIGDFKGTVGIVDIEGNGSDSAGNALTFGADMRFMRGSYIGVDGERHRGAFAFI